MTTKFPPSYYLPIWERADAEEIGIMIRLATPEDQRSLLNSLYECRKQNGGYDNLIIFQPPPAGTLFITHKTVELPD